MVDSTACGWCGNVHGKICPSVKSIEYYENGTVKKVTYVTDGDRMPPLTGGWHMPSPPHYANIHPEHTPDGWVYLSPNNVPQVCNVGFALHSSTNHNKV